MRIFGLEIALSPRVRWRDDTVWHHPPALAKRVGDMTPTELRRELAEMRKEMRGGLGYRMIEKDSHQRIISVQL